MNQQVTSYYEINESTDESMNFSKYSCGPLQSIRAANAINPLINIKLSMEMLEAEIADSNADISVFLDVIIRNTRRLYETID
jgi:hypothetical protein